MWQKNTKVRKTCISRFRFCNTLTPECIKKVHRAFYCFKRENYYRLFIFKVYHIRYGRIIKKIRERVWHESQKKYDFKAF